MTENSLNHELNNLRQRGLVLPRHPERAMASYGESVKTSQQFSQSAGADLDRASMRLGRPITSANYDSPEVQKIMSENNALTRAMGDKRSNSRRIASGGGADVYNAVPRFYDPLEYWDLSGLPWNVADEGHRHKLHKWLRLYYATHYLVPILIDIFTRFPLVGMELKHKDPQIQSVYEDMFLDQLDYPEFLVTLGREHWLVGEAFSLGSFDEDLRIWEREELINPEDVTIDNFPMLGSQQLKIVPPDYLKRLAQLKSPAKEYRLLELNFPELIPYLLRGDHIPISPVLLKQIGNKLNHWDDHGTPILLRGLRTLLHEEKLLASQDAIAERLYSPLILAKLGIQDMGDGLPPFLPGPEELDSVRDDFDIALSSDFRLMVHHFGLEVTSVFGREQMPRLGDDFDRVERRLMQVFGVNPSLLSAGSNSQPYASSALQAEFMNQMLRTFQNTLKKHFRDRAMVVAEAQEHYDYEIKGQAQPLDACILTPSGWTTMGDIRVGNQVIGSDGKSHNVINVFPQGEAEIFQVTFSDGTSTECTENHLWKVTPVHGRSNEPIIISLGELIKRGTHFDSGPAKWKIQTVDPVEFSYQEELPIHPYLLGLLLGDGYFGSEEGASVSLTSGYHDYKEIISKIEELLPSGVHTRIEMKEWAVNIRFPRDRGVYQNPLRISLRKLGLFGKTGQDKFVPEIYLRAPVQDRVALLQGLVDSDGHVFSKTHGVVFSNNSQSLINGVADLVGSLGGCYKQYQQSKEERRKDHKNLRFGRIAGDIVPCRLARKVANYIDNAETRSRGARHIYSIESIGRKEAQCILVDSKDHLYITDDYIVTHNTRIPIYETIVEYDLEGNKTFREVPKLTIPDMSFVSFDLRDEATERQFLQSLRQLGVPIPDEDLMVGVSWDIKDKIGTYNRELKEKTISQQQAKMDTYTALVAKGLPVPLDLKTEVESVLQAGAPGGMPGGPGGMPGGPGGMPGGPGGGEMGGPGASSAGDIVMPEPPPGLGGGPGTVPPGGGPPPTSPQEAGPPGNVPQVSNERRPGLSYNTNRNRVARKEASAIDEFMNEHEDLGVPFEDFVADHNRLGHVDADLDNIPREEIERLWEIWPEYQQEYREHVASEITRKMVELSNDAEGDILEEESEKELEHYQTLSTNDEGKQIILEKRANKRVVTQLPLDKKYSIVDPEA